MIFISDAKNSILVAAVVVVIAVLFYFYGSDTETNTQLSPSEKVSILISRSLEQTGVLVGSSELNEAFFKKHYIPQKLQTEFVNTYGLLHRKIRKVLDEFKSRQSVIHFLLLKHRVLPLDSVTDYSRYSNEAIAKNPLYMAYALVMEEMPDVSKIGSSLYIKQLAKSFGVTEQEIIEGIWYYLQESDVDIFRKVALMIRDNVEDKRSRKPEFYFQNILLPFLTYTSMSLVVHPSIENRLLVRFSEAFKDGRVTGIRNVLFDFTVGLRRYLLGDEFHVRHLNNLNRVLMKYEFRMFVIEETCIGYKIIDYNIPINKRGVGEVRFLTKMSISLSLSYLGLSVMKEKDVVLTMDNFIDCTEDILYTIQNKKPAFNSYEDLPIGKCWDELQIGFPCDTADYIYAALMKKEFGRQSKEEIMNRLFREIAIHEVKHKWDENIKGKSWYNVDAETSAHITEILYGGVPLYSLLSFINRYQAYYCNIDIGEVKEQLQPVIASCWQLARKAANDTISSEQVMQELRTVYDEYKLLGGKGSLPDLDLYYTEIVEPCFGRLPTLALSSIF